MTNLRIYTSYPEGVNGHKGLIEHVLNYIMEHNASGINFDYGIVIYDKVANKVAIVYMTQIVTPA